MTSLPGRDPSDPQTISWRAMLLSIGFALAVVLISAGTIALAATGAATAQVQPKQLVSPDWVGNQWVMYEPPRVQDSERLTQLAAGDYQELAEAAQATARSPWKGGGFLEFGAATLLGAIGLVVWLALFTKTGLLRARAQGNRSIAGGASLPHRWHGTVARPQLTTLSIWPREVIFCRPLHTGHRGPGRRRARHARDHRDGSQRGLLIP